ncbi:MAG: autotransporter-associated beta strand repeat-containing protein, partial [Planctomycetes bacterium]|nr:autotransporter-associated beta strand repeat-containing protein [Planctomycetota bacterium]
MNLAARLLKSLRRNVRNRSSQSVNKKRRQLKLEMLEDRRVMAVLFTTADNTTKNWNTLETNGIWSQPFGLGTISGVSWVQGSDAEIRGPATSVNFTLSIDSGNIDAKSLSNNMTASGSTLTVSATSTNQLVLSGPSVSVGSGVTTTISAPIAGSSGLTKSGAGTLTLSGTNVYSGTTSVNAGVLQVSNGSALGITGAGNGTTVASGARVNLAGVTTSEAFTIAGHGVGTGAILATNTSTVNGVVTLSENSTIGSTDSGVTLNLIGASGTSINNAVGTNPTLTFSSVGTIDISNAVSLGNGGLDKGGSGTVILQAANTFEGQTVIGAGTLEIRNAAALGSTNAGVNLTGGTLALSGGFTVGAETLTLNGLGLSSGGALRNLTGNNTWGGAITLGSATRINSDAGTLTLDVATGNAIGGTNQNLTLGGAGNILISDPIDTGSGSITKDGNGT